MTGDAQSRLRAKARNRTANPKAHKDKRIASTLYLTTRYSLTPASRQYVRFADLVVMAERLHPIPFRTRP